MLKHPLHGSSFCLDGWVGSPGVEAGDWPQDWAPAGLLRPERAGGAG